MKHILMKMIAGVFAIAVVAGCSADSASSSPSATADISAEYALVTAIDGSTITAVCGTVKEVADVPSDVHQSGPDKTSSTAETTLSAEVYYGFKSGGEDLSITIDPDITVLLNGSTTNMSEIDTGDILMLTYRDKTLRGIEILTAPEQ